MTDSKTTKTEGRRERKRRETRERIEKAAMQLFLERGFEATTVEEIAAAADVSKRSFFDYFPSKEDVVFAWQDAFAHQLMASLAARPPDEPAAKAVENALIHAVVSSTGTRGIEIGELIHNTPALKARDQLKYTKLETKLTEALIARSQDSRQHFRVRLLATVVIATLRIAAELWREQPRGTPLDVFGRKIFAELWETLSQFGQEGATETR